jgi:hypothetical protein
LLSRKEHLVNTSLMPTVAPVRLHVGQAVHVNAYATWHAATVTYVTHTRIGVTYHNRHLPAPFSGPVAPHVVRPADGIRLQPAAALRPGDQVLAFDNTRHQVDLVWRTPTGWVVIAYTNGEHTTVPPGAVLRLACGAPGPGRWSQ